MSEIIQLVQVGKETTLGTAVAADKRLLSLKFDFDPDIPAEDVIGQGVKSPVDTVVHKEKTDISYTGELSIPDLIYIASITLCQGVVSTPGGATNTRRWTFIPENEDADILESLTMEKGSSQNTPYRVAGVRGDAMDLTFRPRAKCEMKGKLFGTGVEDGITLTASPTKVAQKIISPRGLDIYLADSIGGLGAGQIVPLEVDWSIKDRLTPVFRLKSSETSYGDVVEKSAQLSGKIVVRKDSTADGYMDDLRGATKKFLKIVGQGANIEGAFYQKLTFTMPINLRKNSRGPNQDEHCSTFEWKAIHDESLGGYFEGIIDSDFAAL